MKIALIADVNPHNKKGVTNYVITKIAKLKELQGYEIEVDCFLIRQRYSWGFRKVTGTKDVYDWSSPNPNQFVADNIKFKVITIKTSAIGVILARYCHGVTMRSREMTSLAESFRDYDVILTHWLAAHYLGYAISKKYAIPHIPTWHGSDINVYAFERKSQTTSIQRILENAYANLFVSKALERRAYDLTKKCNTDYIYTGPDNRFSKFSPEKRLKMRQNEGVENNKVITFVGNLYPIKNVMVLPMIFKRVSETIPEAIFWIVGDGGLKNRLNSELFNTGVRYKMFGNIDHKQMPDIFNMIDILVLPSLNEGLPLVLLEAQACGAAAVGSNVGGISEAIGIENTFDLNDEFVTNISNRIIRIINDGCPAPSLADDFSWDAAISKELNYCKKAYKK